MRLEANGDAWLSDMIKRSHEFNRTVPGLLGYKPQRRGSPSGYERLSDNNALWDPGLVDDADTYPQIER